MTTRWLVSIRTHAVLSRSCHHSRRLLQTSQQPKGRDGALSTLNAAIGVLNRAKGASGTAPTQAAFGSVNDLPTTVRVRSLLFCDEGLPAHTYPGLCGRRKGVRRAWVDLHRHLYSALDRGMYKKKPEDPSQSVREAITQLTT
jgi:hypothetical protein